MLYILCLVYSLRGVYAAQAIPTSSVRAKGTVFTRWGSHFCPPHTAKLYDGIIAGQKNNHRGGGVNFLCMHAHPQYPAGYSDSRQILATPLAGVKYMNSDVLGKNIKGEAACVVCQHNTAKSVYVQWGRVKCSNGHTTQYSGLVMASRMADFKTETICVDLDRALHSTSQTSGWSAKLHTTEFHSKPKAINEKVYTNFREVACAVCAPPELTRTPACEDIAGWTDFYGDDCSTPFYSTGCIPEETVAHANKFGVAAKDACCACGGGERKDKVPAPPPGPVVFTRWGSNTCPTHTTKLYNSFIAGSSTVSKTDLNQGGSFNFLCMHPEPQHVEGSSDDHQAQSNVLHGTQYYANGTSKPLGDAACAVCQDNSTTAVYVQWGRKQCSNGHTTQYSGLIMSSWHSSYKAENVCVDAQRARSNNQKTPHSFSGLHISVMFGRAKGEKKYPYGKALSCAVCSPVKPTRISTRWGSRKCSSSPQVRKLYGGFMAESRSATVRGGGANMLCMHPDPQHARRLSAKQSFTNRLFGEEYAASGIKALDKNTGREAACAVCEYEDTSAVYVQWGRVNCSNGHTTQYSGMIMTSRTANYKTEFICVDHQRAVYATSDSKSLRGGKLYLTEMLSGAMDETKYPKFRELACAVCSANNNTRPATCGFPRPNRTFRASKEENSECTDCATECFEEASWTLKTKTRCEWRTERYASLKLAKKACLALGPARCSGVLDDKCDGQGTFRLCRTELTLAPSHVWCIHIAAFRECGPLGVNMKYNGRKHAKSQCNDCWNSCFQVLNWERHMNINTCERLTGANTVKEAMTRCESYAVKCAGVFQSHYEPKATNGPPKQGYVMLCQAKTIKVLTGLHLLAPKKSVLYTRRITDICGLPDQGKTFKPGKRLTSACKKKCATECFEATKCGPPPATFAFKPGKTEDSPCNRCASECFVGNKTCELGQKWQNNNCTLCGKGEWSSGLTATCTKCQLGRYITKAGSAAGYPCSRCPPGTHSNKDGDQCKQCSPGRYSRSYGLSSGLQCLDCPRGRFGGDQGMTTFEQCTTCPAGRYGVIAGEKSILGACASCPPGRYAEDAPIPLTVCKLCPKGHYRRGIGAKWAHDCIKCSAGQYGADDGLHSCTSCPAGRYSAASATQCSPCPLGTRSGAGMGACSPCNTCSQQQYRSGCFCHEGSTRLRGGAGPWEGRVEMYTLGKWRRVCPHGFNAHAAALVCQSLGFPLEGFRTQAFGRGIGPASARRSLLCSANASSLTSCRSGSESCPHYAWDAGIICCNNCEQDNVLKISGSCNIGGSYARLDPISTRASYEFYSTSTKLYLHKCLANATNAKTQSDRATAKIMWVLARQKPPSNLTPSNLTQCPPHPHASTHVGTAGGESDASLLPATGNWAVSCDSGSELKYVKVWRDGDVRLVGPGGQPDDSQPFQGHLEIFHAGEWGAVCNTDFDNVAASLVCESLGFHLGGLPKSFPRSSKAKRPRVWMDGVKCTGREKGIGDCKFLGWGNHNCGADQGAGVACRTCRPDLCKNAELAECQLHGCKIVSLQQKNLRGKIPNDFQWQDLVFLDLAENQLEGSLPDTMLNWTALKILDVSENQLSGTLSPLWGNMPKLEEFIIDENRIKGNIPSSIGNLRHLRVLDASDNLLEGTLPASLSGLDNLQRLWVGQNLLTGTVPSTFDALDQLDSGTIAGNSLTGAIPTRLAFAGVEVGKTCHPHRHGMVRNGRGSAGVPWCFTGSVCKFTCATDHIVPVNQSDRLQCSNDQNWYLRGESIDVKRSGIECIGKPCKEAPILSEILQRKKASVTHCRGTASGDSCAVACPAFHVRHADAPSFQCYLGRWQTMSKVEASFMQCLESCGEVVKANMHSPFNITNADLSMCKGTPSFIANNKISTGICTFKCHEGYTARKPGSPVIQCVEGQWRRMEATKSCTPKPCLIQQLPRIIRGRLKFPRECQVTESGEVCRYQCLQPFAELPNPTRPTIACSYGNWQVDKRFEHEIRCVKACVNPPPKTLLKNAKTHMCKNIPALEGNFNGSCGFGCNQGMKVLARSGVSFIRCESPPGGLPKWVKLGNTGECTSDLCEKTNEKDNVINIQNFDHHLWKDMYVPENVDQPATDMLDHWDACKDSNYRYSGYLPFRIGCCQKEIILSNGTTIIASGLFPLNSSGTCPRRDNWVSYLEKHKFYSCDPITQHTVFIYVGLVVVTILAILSGGMIILTKLLFGRKDVYKKIQKMKGKISILSQTKSGRKMLSQLSGNYKTTASYKVGIEREQKKHLTHAANAISNFHTVSLKTKFKRKSSKRTVVPLCIAEGDERESGSSGNSEPKKSTTLPSSTQQSTQLLTGDYVVPVVAIGPKRRAGRKKGGQFPTVPATTEQPSPVDSSTSLLRVKQIHDEAERLREKHAASRIQRAFRARLRKKRFERKSELSRMTSKICVRLTGAVKGKIRKYKRLLAGGYISINYTMLMPILLAALDLGSDLLFIWRLSDSQWRIGRYFLVAATGVLGTSILGNFVGFFGIFVYAYRRDKVQDDVWKELMCPWLVLIAITSLTHIGLTALLPWRDRDYYAHPTKCAYMTCTILGYYEAFCQLVVGVTWLVMTKNLNDPITMISISFSSLVLITGFYSSGLKAFLKAKAEVEKETKEKEEAEKQVTIEDLKGEISQMEKDYKKIQDENRALRILCEENYSESDILAATDMGLTV